MALLAVNPDISIPAGLRGRAIVAVAETLIAFWLRHRSTLAVAIDPRLSTIFDNLADAIALVQQISLPGPE